MSETSIDDEYIGTATMDDDGTINMKLRAVGPGIVGAGMVSYAKNHPNYREVLQHLGPIKPGVEVMVKPWPD